MNFCKENRNIANSYFKALKIGGLTAKKVSEMSGVRQASISAFKNGGDIYSSILQKLINALPDEIYRQYLLLLSKEDEFVDNQEINVKVAEQIEKSAFQLRKNRLEKSEK